MKRIVHYYLFFLMLLPAARVQAQCDAPDSIRIQLTNVNTCRHSGAVKVLNIYSSTGSSLRSDYIYALYNATDLVAIVPFQPDSLISGLDSGTYYLHIRQVCVASGTSSADYVQKLYVSGYYTDPVLSAPTVVRDTCGSNGSLSVTATKGYGPYQYCLVDSATAPLIPAHYVRPKQASGYFGGLAAGTYYVRVYDACDNAVTQTVVVPLWPKTVVNSYKQYLYNCDTFLIRAELSTNFTIKSRFWIQYPDGSTDTAAATTTSPNAYYHYYIPLARIAAYYPATVTVGFRNQCGAVRTQSFTIKQPALAFGSDTAFALPGCDSNRFVVGAIQPSDTANKVLVYSTASLPYTAYSKDSGATWTYTTSDTLRLPLGTSIQLRYNYCGKEFSKIIYPLTIPFDVQLGDFSRNSCPGKVGIRLLAITGQRGSVKSIKVHVASKPAAQPAITDFYLDAAGQAPPPTFFNLAPGTYVLQFTDTCGNTTADTITPNAAGATVYSVIPTTVPCSYNQSFRIIASNTKTAHSSVNRTGFNYSFKPTSGSTSSGKVSTSGGGTSLSVDIPGTNPFLTVAPGSYAIRIQNYDPYSDALNTGCDTTIIIDLNLPPALSLAASSFGVCGNDSTAGYIHALPSGGTPPYTYSIYKGTAITPAKLLLGPTTATTDAYFFAGLQPDSVYTLYAADRCGGFTSVTKSFSPLRPLIRTSFSLQPCPGDSVTLSPPLSAGSVSYQWAFNGADISGATGNIYNINPIALSDSGNYTVRMAVTGCSILSAPMELNPGACGMAIPLPLQLLRFTGILNQQGHAQLDWQLADPQPGTKMEILLSTDGRQYTTADVLWPDNNETHFRFMQEQPLTKTSFFKLRVTGMDGTQQHSHTITLQPSRNNTNAVQVSPVLSAISCRCIIQPMVMKF